MIIKRIPIPNELKVLYNFEITPALIKNERILTLKGEDITSRLRQESLFSGKRATTVMSEDLLKLTVNEVILLVGKDDVNTGVVTTSVERLRNLLLSRREKQENFILYIPKNLEYLIYTCNLNKLPDNVTLVVTGENNDN